MSARYVEVLFDFITSEAGEISVLVGDVVEVTGKVDDNWLRGVLDGQEGNFPANHVKPLSFPPLQPGQKLFRATRSFPCQVDGDLGFHTGDLILGLQKIDQNWWQGSRGAHCGIFPVTHVKDVGLKAYSASKPVPESPKLTEDTSNGKCIGKAKANMDLTAQIDDELGFFQGDTINIMEILDADFAIGECGGKIGMFPLAFVDVLEGDINLNDTTKEEKRKSKFRWWEEENTGDSSTDTVAPTDAPVPTVSPSKEAPIDVTPNTQSSSDNVNNTLNEIKTKSGSLKKEFTKTHTRSGSYTADNTRSHDAELTPYGRTLYAFQAENPHELGFSDNEIVTLHRHVDEQWMEGELDGKRGLFPTAYVEIIVDCTHADTRVKSAQTELNNAQLENGHSAVDQPNTPSTTPPSKENTETGNAMAAVEIEMYGRVLYDFKPENPRDLEMQEGDTVTILRKLDEDWFEAKHDDGRVGLCPVSYVEVIVSDPGPTPPFGLQPSSSDLAKRRSQSLSCLAPTKPPVKPKPAVKPKPTGAKPSIVPRKNPPNMSPSIDRQSPVLDKQSNSPTELCSSPLLDKQSSIMTEQHNISSYESSQTITNNKKSSENFKKAMSLDASLEDHKEKKLAMPKTESRPRSEFIVSYNKSADKVWSRSVEGGIPEEFAAELPACPSPLFMEGMSRSASSSPHSDTGIARPRPVPSRSVPAPPARPNPPAVRRNSSGKRPPPPRPSGPRPAPVPPRDPLILIPAPERLPPQTTHPQLVPSRPALQPSRPAPPRPAPSQRARMPSIRRNKSASENLIELSPEKNTEEVNQEVLAELEKRIKQLQDDIQFYTKQKSSLQEILDSTADDAEREEMLENIEFCTANITGFQQEIQQVRDELLVLQPRLAEAEAARKRQAEEEARQRQQAEMMRIEMKHKRREQREKVLQELIQTEQDYLYSLHMCMETFLNSDIPKCPQVDMEQLFGNIIEVMEVSQKLLSSLEAGTKGKNFHEQISGTSFVELKDEMKKAYAPYCRNHDDVIHLLTKYEESPEIQEYLSRVVDAMRQHAAVFDLGSVLIKPVQRILKYPLLLNEIIKSTEDDHPDKPHLLTAIKAMTEVAAHINEYKRRKDLVLKYRKEADQSLSDKFGRFNVHSTKKKFTRVTRRMVGVSTVDENFNREERKFANLDKTVRTFLKNIVVYLDLLQEAVASQESVANDIMDYYAENNSQQEVQQFSCVHNTIASIFYKQFREDVELHVVNPLKTLLMMFQGPSKVIKKRHDKLLDYESFASKTKGLAEGPQLRALKADLQAAKNNYEALNSQLLDELPKLYSLCLDIIQDCSGRLIQAQQQFYSKTLEQMYKLLSLPLVLGTDNSCIMEAFNIAHVAVVDKMSDLSFIPHSFNPRLDEKAPRGKRLSMSIRPGNPEDGLMQTDSQRVYVLQQYPPAKLFQVMQDSPVIQMMDLALPQGSVVGVIKEGDPMGNKDRWFIDNGAQKGFILKRYLAPASKQHSRTSMSPVTSSTPTARCGSPAVSPAGAPISPAATPISPAGAPSPVPASGNLMDLSSPEAPVPAKATPIPDDLDFSMTSATSSMMGSGWYERAFWDEATTSPPSILTHTAEDTHHVAWDDEVDKADEPNGKMQKAAEAACAEDDRGTDESCDLPPDYSELEQDTSAEYYQAVYPFTARSPVEVSLGAGEMVTVLRHHDLDGNSEWWLVETSSGQGYAPANYLYKVQ